MEPVYVIVRAVVLGVLWVFFRLRLIGVEKIPKDGAVIIASNHISNFDPLCVAYLVDRARRRPRFLAKASLWKNLFMKVVLNGCRQIPVNRGTGEVRPMEAAERAIEGGQCVVIYPEGTITTHEDLTPMQGKTGVARLALATGAPVYPVAVWGAQWVIPKGRRGRYRFRMLITMKVGERMEFADEMGRHDEAPVRREVTDRVMTEVDRLVRELWSVTPGGSAVPALKPKKKEEA